MNGLQPWLSGPWFPHRDITPRLPPPADDTARPPGNLLTSERRIPRNEAAEASAMTSFRDLPGTEASFQGFHNPTAWPSFPARYSEIVVPARRVPSRSKATTSFAIGSDGLRSRVPPSLRGVSSFSSSPASSAQGGARLTCPDRARGQDLDDLTSRGSVGCRRPCYERLARHGTSSEAGLTHGGLR